MHWEIYQYRNYINRTFSYRGYSNKILFIQRLFPHRGYTLNTLFIQNFSHTPFIIHTILHAKVIPTWIVFPKIKDNFFGPMNRNIFLQNKFLQRLFLQDSFHTEVTPTQRLDLQHNIPTEFLSTLLSSYILFFIQRFFLHEKFSEKIYHKFLLQRTE